MFSKRMKVIICCVFDMISELLCFSFVHEIGTLVIIFLTFLIFLIHTLVFCFAKLNEKCSYLFQVFVKIPIVSSLIGIFLIVQCGLNDCLMIIFNFWFITIFNVIYVYIWIIDDNCLIERIRVDSG